MRCAEYVRLVDLRPHESSGDDASERAQAVDVHSSVIVQAPAGSGKTTLLVERLLNLLAVVDRPEEILAITLTRKAAAEMRARVLRAIRSDDSRVAAIRARSQALGWRLEEQPSRLRIQTIDSFAAALVHRLPITSGFGADMRILEDVESLYREAVDRVFDGLDPESPFRTELIELLKVFDNDYARARTSMIAMLRRRDQWLEVAMLTLRAGGPDAEGKRGIVVARAIEDGIRSLHRSAIDDLIASLDAEQRVELETNAAHAAERLDRPWCYAELPDDVDGWRFIAELITTRDGEPRVRLGRAQGFYDARTANQLAKARLKALIDALSLDHLIPQIAALRELPATPMWPGEVKSIIAIATGLALCAIELEKLFRRERAIDFTELAFAAHRAIGTADAPTDLALALDYQIKHVLIDEFQDTSAIQYRLFVRLLQEWQTDDGRTLFVVGDPMQSIYRFRDADVALFQRARRNGIGTLHLRSIRLSRNFRSSAALVDWCNNAFAGAFGAVEDPILGQVSFSPSASTHAIRSDDGCRTYVAATNDVGAPEAAALVQTIEQIRRAHPGESIAVLARSRVHLAQVLPRMTQRRVPWVGTDIDLLAERPVINDMMSLARALSSDADRLAWLALLRAPFVGMSLRDLETIAQAERGPASAVRDGTHDHLVSEDARARLARIRPILRHAETGRGQQRVRQWFEAAYIRLGGADAYADPDAMTQAQRFLELIDDGHARVLNLAALEDSISRLFAQSAAGPDSVVVMTMHRAKGLEFDHVLLPELHRVGRIDDPPPILWRAQRDQLLLGVQRIDNAGSLYRWLQLEAHTRDANELIRLLYVAATRARHSLHLFATLEFDGTTWRTPPSRSLLAPIWHCVADRAEIIRPVDLASIDAGPSRDYRALPAHYAWSPPAVVDDLTAAEGVVAEKPTRHS